MTPELTSNGEGNKRLVVKGEMGKTRTLYLDGILIEDSRVSIFDLLRERNDEGRQAKLLQFKVAFDALGTNLKLMNVEVQDIDNSIRILECNNYDLGTLNIRCVFSLSNGGNSLSVSLKFDSTKWKKLWSFDEFLNELNLTFDQFIVDESYDAIRILEHGITRARFYGAYTFSDLFIFPIPSQNTTLQEQIYLHKDKILYLYNETERRLQAKLDENSLINHFKFHPAFQGACEEYLWSFIQFLRDMGVEAEGKLEQDKEHPGQVLFAVTPAKGKEALGKIQQALDLYIAFAGVKNFELDENASIQIERLQIRIERFQSDLRMAKLELRTQAAEIRAQETTEFNLTVALDKVNEMNVFLKDRVEQLEKEKKLKKHLEFFDGWVIIENPKFAGVSINLAKLWPYIKRAMSEEGLPELPPSPERPTLPPSPEE